MLLLGHTGLPLGVAWGLARGRGRRPLLPPFAGWVLVGSMGPDLVDKPLGMWLLAEQLSNGRVFGHTLLVGLLLLGIALRIRVRRGAVGPLAFALAWLGHLFLDRMWRTPETLLWPLLGFSFPRYSLEGYPLRFLKALQDPWNLAGEVLGGLVLAFLAGRALRMRTRMPSLGPPRRGLGGEGP